MALYAISIRQNRVSPPSFFRFRLATDTLDLSYILPTAGRIQDFHPLDHALTGRTNKKPIERGTLHTLDGLFIPGSCLTRHGDVDHFQRNHLPIFVAEMVIILQNKFHQLCTIDTTDDRCVFQVLLGIFGVVG